MKELINLNIDKVDIIEPDIERIINNQCNEFIYNMVYCSDKYKMLSTLIEIYEIIYL